MNSDWSKAEQMRLRQRYKLQLVNPPARMVKLNIAVDGDWKKERGDDATRIKKSG